MKDIFELILIALIVLLGEVLVFLGFLQCIDEKREKGCEHCTSQPSGEGEFWQNIISYDHRKGGETD